MATKPLSNGALGRIDRQSAPGAAVLVEREPGGEAEEPQQTVSALPPIPNEMWGRIVESLTFFVEEELTLCDAERGEMMRRLARWTEAYLAPMATSPKNFPIHNASNLTMPVIKEAVHTIAAQVTQSVANLDPTWHFQDLAAEWEPFVDDLERFMALAGERDLSINRFIPEYVIQSAILGTAVAQVAHKVDSRRVYQYSADGKKVYPKEVIFHDGPSITLVPLGSFWIRMHERDPNKARWCAKRLLLSELEIRERVASKKFIASGVEEMLDFYDDPGEQDDPQRKKEDELVGQKPQKPSRFEIFEIFVSFDVDNDGRFEELHLFYHRDSRKFIGRNFLENWNGKRGFVKLGYFPRPDRFYDEGLAELLEQIQAAVSAVVNRRADNATMANLKMLLKRKILKNLQPGDPLYTGKIIEVNDIWNDVREFSMAEIYPSTVSEEQLLRQVGDRLSGLNEAALGAAMPVTRTTASAQMALLQEQRNRIGLTVANARHAIGQIGALTLDIYTQFGANGKAIAWLGERGKLVEAIFRLPRRATELGLAIRVSVPTSVQNRQAKRENAIGLFNLFTALYEKLLPMVAQLAPEAMAEVTRALVKSSRRYMEDVLESFEQSDPETVLEGLATIERLLPAPENLGGMESFDRRAETASLLDGVSRLEGLLREAEDTRRGNVGTPPGNERARRTTPPERAGRGGADGILFGGESNFRS